jgi:hypothetical protein
MNTNKENLNNIIEKDSEYQIQRFYFKGMDQETFDFDTEFAKGLTTEQAKAGSIKRIREWWPDNFDTEFAKGLTAEEFKAEISKRIKAYPWEK